MEKQDQKTRPELLKLAKDAPTSPGVYLMKDGVGGILYVGKAKNLRNRVSSYFQAAEHERARTEMMVNRVGTFEMILTETEAEALLLESTLIKKHKPKFNVLLKDDKAYPYIKVALDEDFPRLEWTRRVKKDGARYFGPFPSAWSAKQVLRLLNEVFLLRDCSENTFKHRSRPCLLYQIERCSAPCVGKVSPEDYHSKIKNAVNVLEGNSAELMGELKTRMSQAAEEEEFEVAAFYRDQIQNIQLVTETQAVVDAAGGKNWDVVGVALKETEFGVHAQGTVLEVRAGKLVSVQHATLSNVDPSDPKTDVLGQLLLQRYATRGEEMMKQKRAVDAGEAVDGPGPDWTPQAVLLGELPADADLMEPTLGVEFVVGETREQEQLLNVAVANAEHSLELNIKKHGGHGLKALEEVQKKLQLGGLPTRIECFDISNIQDTDAVASRVVFVDGAPDKNLYRRYKIKTVDGQNDFAMMKEVLGRRFSNTTEALPELVVVDGGKGQLAQAVAILEELNVQGVAVVGLAKARTESDFKKKEVESSQERIFIPGRKNPIALYSTMPAYKLLVHVRDEAHRFAVNYHRKVRSKRTMGRQK